MVKKIVFLFLFNSFESLSTYVCIYISMYSSSFFFIPKKNKKMEGYLVTLAPSSHLVNMNVDVGV